MQYHHYNPGNTSNREPQQNRQNQNNISNQTSQQNRQNQSNTSNQASQQNRQNQSNTSNQTSQQNRQNQNNYSGFSNHSPRHNSQVSQNDRSNGDTSINRNQPTGRGSGNMFRNTGGRQESAQCSQHGKKIHLNSLSSLLHGFLPPSVYDTQSKKIFGFLTAEDLLLIALIFLYAESDSDDNSIMVLVLIYLLISEYIDLPDFSF